MNDPIALLKKDHREAEAIRLGAERRLTIPRRCVCGVEITKPGELILINGFLRGPSARRFAGPT